MILSGRLFRFTWAHLPMKRFSFLLVLIVLSRVTVAQAVYSVNNDSTAVPFLRISPDARAGGMGDGGVACSTDANAVHWNLANLSFAKKKFGMGISYTPWLRALVPDINLVYVGFFVKPDSVSAIGASLRYFSLGNVVTSGIAGNPTQYRPNEFAFDVGYTRKLADHFAVGLAIRFIQSNPGGINGIVVRDGGGRACAGDITAAWRGSERGNDVRNIRPVVGVAITNIGTKMWYEDRDSAEFLPVNARFGGALEVLLAQHHAITLHGEANKLLTPLPEGIHTLGEKLAQINLSTGAEYCFNHTFKVRGGYFHEFVSHGNNRYVTCGLGIEYNVFQLDFSYLIPVGGQRSPLENTLRFSLLFAFEGAHHQG